MSGFGPADRRASYVVRLQAIAYEHKRMCAALWGMAGQENLYDLLIEVLAADDPEAYLSQLIADQEAAHASFGGGS